MYDIRQICMYNRSIHSRYYIDTNGVVYSSLSPNTTKIMIEGVKYNITSWKKQQLNLLNKWNNLIIRFKETNYFLMYDGTVLKRLKTMVSESNEVSVSIITIDRDNKTGSYFSVSRLVAQVFLGDITNKEVHHIDRNRLNNNVNNLKILSMEEHRGKNNYHKNHT